MAKGKKGTAKPVEKPEEVKPIEILEETQENSEPIDFIEPVEVHSDSQVEDTPELTEEELEVSEKLDELPKFERNLPKTSKGKEWTQDPTELESVEGSYEDLKGIVYLGKKK